MLKKAVSILLVAIMLFINTATNLRVVFAEGEETVEESNREFNKTANWVDKKIGSEAEIVLTSKLKSTSNDTNILFLGGLCSAHSLEKETVKNAINACAQRGNVDYYLYSTTRDLETYVKDGNEWKTTKEYDVSTYNGKVNKGSTFNVEFGDEFTHSRHSCLYNIAYRINNTDVSNYQLIVLETDALRMGIYYKQDNQNTVSEQMKTELLNAAKKLKELYKQNKIVWIIPNKNATIHDSGASSYKAQYVYNEYYLTANPSDGGEYYSKGVYDSLAILAPEDWLNDEGTARRKYNNNQDDYPTFSKNYFNNVNNYRTLKNRCSGETDPNKINYNEQIWINYGNSDDVVNFIDAKIDLLEYDEVEITDVVNDGFTIESIKGYSYDAAKKDYVEVKNDSSNVRFSYVQDVDNKQKVTGIFNTKSIGTTNVKMVITAKVAEQSPFTADSNIVNTNKGKATAKYYEKTEYIETKEKESPTLEYPRYQITTQATNGTIDSTCYVLEGDNKTISYSPNDGYELESIKVDNVSQDITTYSNGYTFSNVTSDHSIEVKYKAIPKYTITYTDGVDGEEVFKDQVYTDKLAGSDTPGFSGTPTRNDYTFTGWNPEVSEKVTGDATYVAQWKLKDEVIIEYVSEDTNKGTVSNAKDELLPDTGIATGSTASASTGYHFVNWTNSNGDEVSTNEEFVPTKPTDAWVYEKYTAHFAPNTNTAYKVEYYYQNDDGTYPTLANKVSEQRTGTTGENASITNDDKEVEPPSDIAEGRTYVLNDAMNSDWEKVIQADGSTILKVYYKQQYKVTYKKGDHGTFSNDVHDKLDYGVNTPTLSDTCKNNGVPKGEEGYSFIGWEPEVDSTVTKNAEYVAKWSPNPNTGYKVEHYIEGLDGKYTLKETEVIQEAETGKEVTATTKTYTGYSYNEELSEDTISGTVSGDGSTVLKVYYSLKETGYTVNYYENNTDNKIAESKVVTGKKFGENVKEPAITIDGYTVTSLSSNGGEIGALNEDFNDNVINLYYYKNVSLNGNNDTVTYDGNTHEVNGYITIDDDKNVIHDVLFTDPSDNTKDFVAKTDGIYVGEYIEHIPTTLIGKVDKSQRYIVTNVSDGKLIILPTEVQNYISKTHEDRTYKLNETVTFTITVKNIYKEKHTITLQELENVTLDNNTFIDVEPGETISATAAYKITNEDLLANGFKNVVKVSFSNISTEMSVEDDVITEDVNREPTIKKITEYVAPKTGIK